MKTFRQYLKESVNEYKVVDIDDKKVLGKYSTMSQAEKAAKENGKKYKNYVVYDNKTGGGVENANSEELRYQIQNLEAQGFKDLRVEIEVSNSKFY